MNDCDEWIERMPELAQGRAPMPAGFAAHLEQCAECRSNWQVIQAGARIGVGAGDAIDAERMAATVMARLGAARQADRRRRGWVWGSVAAAAAALLIVVQSGRTPTGATDPTPGTVAVIESDANFVVPVSGLDDLDATELQSIYDQLDGALSNHGSVSTPHLEELSPDEMEQVLNSLEG